LLQVGRVQHMINNEPASALGGQMTRSQALFGEPNLASDEYIAQLLGSGRYAGVCSLQAAGDSPAAPATRTAGRRAPRAPITGRKRSTAEADLAEDAELAELAAVAAQDGTAAPAMRSKRVASGRLMAVLALEH
jgi:hypothetical protein